MQKTYFFIITIFITHFLPAQVKEQVITLAEADQLLIKNNLTLLAAKYNIDVAEAQKIQSKLFDNPEFSFTIPAYSKEEGWFDVNGDFELSLQQAIQIAGKRKAGIQLAESQKQLANWQYELLVKQMKYAVHSSFFTIYYLQQSINKTKTEVVKIKNIIDALQVQYKKGNVTLSELVRMKATYNSLSTNILELQNQIYEEKNNLKIMLLLAPNLEITPYPEPSELNKYTLSLLNYSEIIEKAKQQHPEIKLAEANEQVSRMQLKYEKKQIVPDLQLSVGYSKNGDYVRNLTTAGLGINIPLFNRNQGNIKVAEYQLKQAQVEKENEKNLLENRIALNFDKIKAIEERAGEIDSDFEEQFDLLMTNVSDNYMKRNLSLLEFTDLIESYHEQIVQLNELRLQKIMAYEELEYNTGYTLSDK